MGNTDEVLLEEIREYKVQPKPRAHVPLKYL